VLTEQAADKLLDVFRTRMKPNFPFVIIPDSATTPSLWEKTPCLTLALLTVSSFENKSAQQNLGTMFNRMISSRMLHGRFACLDTLQGLLVSLAW
jgi:hypothetical protein